VDCAKNPRTKGDDNGEVVEVMNRGLEYCAVSKSAYRRLKDEFEILTKKQRKSNDAAIANLEKAHADEVNLHRQLEEGYRSGLKSMGAQSNKFRRESVVLKKEKSSMIEKMDVLKKADGILHAHANALEETLREKNLELKEVRSLGDLRAEKMIEYEHKIEGLEVDLGSRTAILEIAQKTLRETRGEVSNLAAENEALANKVVDLTVKAGSQEEKLRAIRAEASEKNSILEGTLKVVETLTSDNEEKDERIAALVDQNDALEAENAELSSDLASKESTIESNNERISDLTLKWHSMTDQSREQALTIAALIGTVASLESDLRDRTSDSSEAALALAESRGRMEVLLRNLDAVLRHNVEQANRIEALNGAVVSLSASLNAFIVPSEHIQKAKAAQSEAMNVLLAEDDQCLLAGKLSEQRETIMSANASMDELIRSAEPAALEGISWEHCQKEDGDGPSVGESDSFTSSTPSLNLSASEVVAERERTTIEEMFQVAQPTVTTPAKFLPFEDEQQEEEPVPADDDVKDEDTEVDSYHHDDGDTSSVEKEEEEESDEVAAVASEANVVTIMAEDIAVLESASVDSTVCDEAIEETVHEVQVEEAAVEEERKVEEAVEEEIKVEEAVQEEVWAVPETVEEEAEETVEEEVKVEETVEEAVETTEETAEEEPKEVIEEVSAAEERVEAEAEAPVVEEEPECEEEIVQEEMPDLIRFDSNYDEKESTQDVESSATVESEVSHEEDPVEEEETVVHVDTITDADEEDKPQIQEYDDDDNTSVGDLVIPAMPSGKCDHELV